MKCLNELRKQQVIDQHVYDQKLMEHTMRKLTWEGLQKNIVMEGDAIIDKRTGVVLDPEVIPHTGKKNFKPIFYGLYRP